MQQRLSGRAIPREMGGALSAKHLAHGGVAHSRLVWPDRDVEELVARQSELRLEAVPDFHRDAVVRGSPLVVCQRAIDRNKHALAARRWPCWRPIGQCGRRVRELILGNRGHAKRGIDMLTSILVLTSILARQRPR